MPTFIYRLPPCLQQVDVNSSESIDMSEFVAWLMGDENESQFIKFLRHSRLDHHKAKMLDAGLRTLSDLGSVSDSTLQGPIIGMNAEEVQRLRTKLTQHPRGASGNDM